MVLDSWSPKAPNFGSESANSAWPVAVNRFFGSPQLHSEPFLQAGINGEMGIVYCSKCVSTTDVSHQNLSSSFALFFPFFQLSVCWSICRSAGLPAFYFSSSFRSYNFFSTVPSKYPCKIQCCTPAPVSKSDIKLVEEAILLRLPLRYAQHVVIQWNLSIKYVNQREHTKELRL